jgi:hypothetical protein
MADFNWAQYEEKPKTNFDWSRYEELPETSQESTGIGGVATDALSKGLGAVYSMPSNLMQLPGEAYGAVKQGLSNPKRALGNLAGGTAEFGHEILSAPGSLRDYLVRKQLLSEETPSLRLPQSVLPKEYNYPEALGVQGNEAGDALLQGAAKGIAMAPFANKLFAAAQELPVTRTMAAKHLKEAERMGKERNIGKMPLSKGIIKETKEFLKGDANKKLIQEAAKGDYSHNFTLQSDLGKAARELLKSSSGAERLQGKAANQLRQRMLSEMKGNLAKGGHEDIAAKMSKGQNKYRQYNKLAEKVYPHIKKAGVPLTYLGLGALGYKGAKKLFED